MRASTAIAGGLFALTFGATYGISTQQARTAAPTAVTGSSASEGSSLAFARADHQHGSLTAPVITGTLDARGTISDSTGNLTLGDAVDVSGAITSSVASGSNAIALETGARLDFGGGANDHCFSSGGTLIACGVEVGAPSLFADNTLNTSGTLSVDGTATVGGTAVFGVNDYAVTIDKDTGNIYNAQDISSVSMSTGAVTATSVNLGGGTITDIIPCTLTSMNFTALAANSCEVLTMTCTGAADGDVCAVGALNALADADGATERTTIWCWASSANTVSVRRCNNTGTITVDPAAANVRAVVTKY